MQCDATIQLLSARLDGELSPREAGELTVHLAACADCRAIAEVMEAQDKSLRSAVAPGRAAAARIAENVIAQLAISRSSVAYPRGGDTGRRSMWVIAVTSAAAGFVIACLLLRPWHKAAPKQLVTPGPDVYSATQPARPVAKLALATGEVFVCPISSQSWTPMPTGGAVREGDRLRTGPAVRCEVKTSDGSEVRLNAGTEVCFNQPRGFELVGGEVWSTVAKAADPFQAVATGATFTALGTQFDLVSAPGGVTLTVAEGLVRAAARGSENTVGRGERLTVSDGRMGDKTAAHDLAVATRWLNEILILKGRDSPELASRVDDLFAQIGEQKMSFMYEEEIRALGDHCVVPLSRYIESERSRGNPARRATAARLVGDAAPSWAIPELIRLLEDTEGEVRFYAAVALKRLTGKSFSRDPEQWRADNRLECLPTADAWRGWWEKNKDRYPGADSSPLQLPREMPVVKEGAGVLKTKS